jgi:hypothetical protein
MEKEKLKRPKSKKELIALNTEKHSFVAAGIFTEYIH